MGFREQQLNDHLNQSHKEDTILPDEVTITIDIYNEAGIEKDFLLQQIKDTIKKHYPRYIGEIEVK